MILGHVVIEYNQASGQPRICSGDDLLEEYEAKDAMDKERALTKSIGRRERYVIAEVEYDEYADEDRE
ncbi:MULTISPECIES: hypothetical protein [unclassified Cryobacterium]|uniref:hypothetical protein n=1 Tax=unclassified Cryobacterium TaxID=2649013 RepID=UPI002AB58EA5|nr:MULTISPECIES: hypothetical protein [unclassified Cryobacterium]MDY7542627.1 hypothetical protein [Cryobacterium sp. 5B3]MEB0264747.1 hypothetical protein [Cryobacterium sp. 10I5]MEB0273719.1 hypothetical protein [Cryobacterium sp. 5B3]